MKQKWQSDPTKPLQRCTHCGAPTDKCEEDQLCLVPDEPLCEACFGELTTKQ